MKHEKVKVLYVAGFERSGSTIVNRVLGQIDGFVAWGELRDIWEHGFVENRLCTCGASFSDCEAWNHVFSHNIDAQRAAEMVQLKKRTRAAVLLKSLGKAGERFIKERSQDYLNELEHFYTALKFKTNSQVVVDSTKASWYGYALSLIPNIDLYTVHVVRDPRGVCYSLQQRKAKGEPECQWYNPAHAALSWNLKNLAVERLLNTSPQRYVRIQYENFMKFPEASIKSLIDLLSEPVLELPFMDNGSVKMTLDHIITGSPSSRSNTGEVKLNLDERWKQGMQPADQAIVKNLTLPLLKRYGYLSSQLPKCS